MRLACDPAVLLLDVQEVASYKGAKKGNKYNCKSNRMLDAV